MKKVILCAMIVLLFAGIALCKIGTDLSTSTGSGSVTVTGPVAGGDYLLDGDGNYLLDGDGNNLVPGE